jgi:hypothetical protein
VGLEFQRECCTSEVSMGGSTRFLASVWAIRKDLPRKRARLLPQNEDGSPARHSRGGRSGGLYHLKNPFRVLENLASLAQYCLLSTRVARHSPDGRTAFDHLPVAYLVDPSECNNDATNYWVFSTAGLTRILSRSGWELLAKINTGSQASDPVNQERDERAFILMKPSPRLLKPERRQIRL